MGRKTVVIIVDTYLDNHFTTTAQSFLIRDGTIFQHSFLHRSEGTVLGIGHVSSRWYRQWIGEPIRLRRLSDETLLSGWKSDRFYSRSRLPRSDGDHRESCYWVHDLVECVHILNLRVGVTKVSSFSPGTDDLRRRRRDETTTQRTN